MKKKFIQLFMFAATMLTATTLTSCGEDIIENGSEITAKSEQTVFSCDDDLTRTSINNKRAFFWEVGDKIWVNDGTQWNKSTKSDITDPNTPTAKFVLPGSYTEEEYQLLYTGYTAGDTATTQYNKVTIANVQTQKAWNDGSHLGTSGDCGTAKAYKQTNGNYRFSLEHKASYLLIYPYIHTDLTGDYTLEKIEIYSDLSATDISGTFDFTYADGLADHPDTGTGKQEITLNCGNLAAGEFGLLKTAPVLSDVNNAAPHCFVVIAPGMHQLTIRYVAKKTADGTKYDFIKDIALKEYKPNGVYTFVHELRYAEVDYGFEFNEDNTFYRWGATVDVFHTPEEGNVYNASATTDLTDGFWATIPNVKAFSWYLSEDIYYDNATKWDFNHRDGTQTRERGGWWLKKKDYISGFSTTTESGHTYSDVIHGRPASASISEYFFLPEIYNNDAHRDLCLYWLSTPGTTVIGGEIVATTQAIRASFTHSSISYTTGGRANKDKIAGLRPDGTPWFQ